MLKKITMGAVFAALMASSALAQSYQPEWGSGNIVPGSSGGFVSSPNDAQGFGAPYAGAYLGTPSSRAYAYERPAHRRSYRQQQQPVQNPTHWDQ
jgi:hypothetical protein